MLFSGGNDLSDVKVSVVRMQGLPYRASEDDIVRIRFLSVNFSPYFIVSSLLVSLLQCIL